MAVLEGFKKVSIALVGVWLSRCRILWFQSSRSFVAAGATGTGLLGRAALAPPPPAIGTDFSIVSFAMLLAVISMIIKRPLPHR
jgi:hypothetical protein